MRYPTSLKQIHDTTESLRSLFKIYWFLFRIGLPIMYTRASNVICFNRHVFNTKNFGTSLIHTPGT